jgi:hypothetical protein
MYKWMFLDLGKSFGGPLAPDPLQRLARYQATGLVDLPNDLLSVHQLAVLSPPAELTLAS